MGRRVRPRGDGAWLLGNESTRLAEGGPWSASWRWGGQAGAGQGGGRAQDTVCTLPAMRGRGNAPGIKPYAR